MQQFAASLYLALAYALFFDNLNGFSARAQRVKLK